MARKGSWYFEGFESHYETGKNGKKKRVFDYVGEYYGLRDVNLRRIRILATVDIIFVTLFLLLINFLPGKIGMIVWVGAPCLWAFIPLIFLWMGLINFLTCGDKWMIRQYYAGYRRMRWSSVVSLIIMIYVTVAHIVFLFLTPDTFPGELYYTAGSLVCALLSGLLVVFQKNHPAVVVQGPAVR